MIGDSIAVEERRKEKIRRKKANQKVSRKLKLAMDVRDENPYISSENTAAARNTNDMGAAGPSTEGPTYAVWDAADELPDTQYDPWPIQPMGALPTLPSELANANDANEEEIGAYLK